MNEIVVVELYGERVRFQGKNLEVIDTEDGKLVIKNQSKIICVFDCHKWNHWYNIANVI